jgi:hypothetical protein
MIDFENLKENNSGHWTYKGSDNFEVPLEAFGFVYLIEKINPLLNEKSKYIGRKYLTAAKTTSKKVLLKSGAKVTKKKKSRVESDWQGYTGSCLPLNSLISKLGKESFRFEILAFAPTRGTTNFLECFFQMRANVLAEDSYFNEAIGSGQFRGVRFDSDFKKLLKEFS